VNTHRSDQPDEFRDDPTLDVSQSTPPAPSDTQQIEQSHTQQIETEAVTVNAQHQAEPSPSPFRVEPATPVPDDALQPEGDTTALPSLPTPPPSTRSTASGPAAPSAPSGPPRQGLVTVRRGPLPMTIMLGLLSLIVAGYVLATNLMGADFDMRVAGPTMFGSFGGLLLIVGLVGVIAGGRGRNHD
jgi:hypothetical protein